MTSEKCMQEKGKLNDKYKVVNYNKVTNLYIKKSVTPKKVHAFK